MVAPIPANQQAPQAAPPFALRRQLIAELAELNEVLLRHPMVDRMSVRLDEWHRRFTLNLNTILDEETTLADAVRELHGLLKDPVEGSPLEERSFLGNDDQVYGHKALCYYLNHMPEGTRGKSPFAPQQEALFVVWPHPIVDAAVRWLQRRGCALPPLQYIADHFSEMERLGTVPEMPTEGRIRFQERVRRMAARQAERDQANATAGAQAATAAQEAAAANVDGAFEGVRANLEETARRQRERLEAEQARDAAARAELRTREARWNGRVSRLAHRNDALDGRLSDVQTGTQVAEQDTAQLAVSIQETKKAIDDRDAARDKNGWKEIAIVVVAGAAAYATGGSSAAVEGGAKAGIIIAI